MIVKANRMICLKSRVNAMQLILDYRWSCAKFKGCWCCKGELLRQSPRLMQWQSTAHEMFFLNIYEKFHSWKLRVTSGIPYILWMLHFAIKCHVPWFGIIIIIISIVVDTRKWRNQFGFVSWQAVCFYYQWLISCPFFSPLTEENSASTIIAAKWMQRSEVLREGCIMKSW